MEDELEQLTRRVTEVYVECGFDHDPSVSVSQMLTNIEAKMEEYFAAIDKLPPKVVADLERKRRRNADDWRENKRLGNKSEIKRFDFNVRSSVRMGAGAQEDGVNPSCFDRDRSGKTSLCSF